VEKIRISLGNRGAGTAPVFAAVEGGYLREQGLDATLIPHEGHSVSLRTLLAGEADFANAVGAEVLRANTQEGGDLVVIASAISRSAQQVSARPGITTREQLRHKRWGVIARNDADECAIVMAFECWGWDPARDADIVVVGPGGPRLDLLLDESRVDVAIMHAPDPFQAARRGWQVVEDLGRLDIAAQNSCAITTRRLLRDHPETALRYARAYCQGVWRFRTDAAFGVEVLRKYTGETDPAVLGATWVMFARYMGGMMFPSLEGMRNAGRLLHRLGVLLTLPAAEACVDFEPVAALEREGFFGRLMGVAA
jgi:ABC-type nitrate/sulfonate/bicarbonate transport system substrate-binding protein